MGRRILLLKHRMVILFDQRSITINIYSHFMFDFLLMFAPMINGSSESVAFYIISANELCLAMVSHLMDWAPIYARPF